MLLILAVVAVAAIVVAGCRKEKSDSESKAMPETNKTAAKPASEPGRNGIESALDGLYPKAKDWRFAGPDNGDDRPAIAEFEVYRSTKSPDHWHYLTYGLSEIGEKESDDPKESGWGIELTMRVKAGDETAPPPWPMHVLNRLAEYVWESGNPFSVNHVMRVPGLPVKDTQSQLTSVAFVADAELGTINTSNGKVLFLQAYGITRDEEELLARWDTEKFLAEIGTKNPRWVTELERDSYLSDSLLGPKFEESAKREGSQRSVEFITTLEMDRKVDDKGVCNITWAIDPTDREILARALRYRLGYGKKLQIFSSEPALEIAFSPSDEFSLKCEDKILSVGIPAKEANGLADRIVALTGELRIPVSQHRFVLKPFSEPALTK